MNIKKLKNMGLEIEKIADISKDKDIKVNFIKHYQNKAIIAITNKNGDIKNVVERKEQSLVPFIQNGGESGKPSQSSVALKVKSDDGDQLYKISYSEEIKDKNDVLEKIKEIDGKYPKENKQKNNEKLDKEVIEEHKNIINKR